MIINSITLDNFKSHKHSHIDLDKGISLILGRNGAGKSSIFEAISYSFFKTFDGKIEDIIRKPIDDNDIADEMKVTVEFENDGTLYKLIRGKRKSKNLAKLSTKKDDKFKILCEGDTLVTHEIESLLGLDSKSFTNAIYIKQGDITKLIEKTSAERKEFIAKLLNIDDLEKAWEEMKNIINNYKNQKAENDGKLSRKSEVEEQITHLEKLIDENNIRLNDASPKTEELKEELDKLLKKVNDSDNNKNEFNNQTTRLDQQKRLIDSYNKQLNENEDKLQQIELFEKECVELKKYVIRLPYYKELKEYKLNLDKENVRLNQVTAVINDIKNNERILKENKDIYEKYILFDKELEELNNNRKDLEVKIRDNNEITVKLSEKEKRKEANFNYIQQTSEYASKIFNSNFNSPEEVERKVIDEKEKTEKTIENLTKNINENNEEISVKRNELKNTKKSLNDLENTKETCPICQSPISHEKHEELSEKYKNDINNFEKIINDLLKENEKKNIELRKCNEYLEEIEDINISKLKDQYDEFKTLNEEITDLNKLLPQIEEDNELLKQLDENIQEKDDYKNSVKDVYNQYLVANENLKKTDIEKEEERLKEINSNITDLRNKCQEIVERFSVKDNLDQTIKYAEIQVDQYNQKQGIINEKDSYLKQKEEITNNIKCEEKTYSEIEDKINNLNYDDEENQKLHETYISQQAEYDENKEIITKLNVEIEKDNSLLKEYQSEFENLSKTELEQKHLTDYIKALEKIREIYSKDGVQKELRDAARPSIEKNTMDIFNDFDFDYSSLILTEDYDIIVENKNEKLEFKMMSGGEKIAIALALRLGIARVVSKHKTQLLMLDEPTIHLDDERRDSLIEIIGKNTIVPQMIVVTHDDGMEALSNHIIKISKVNGISHVDNS